MKYKVILFDLDGTLTDSQLGVTKSVSYALSSLGFTPPDLSELKKFIGPPLQKSFPKFYNLNEDKTNFAISKYREYFEEYGINENELYPYVSEVLSNLKNKGYKIVLATSKPEVFARQILENFNINHYFDGIFGASLDGSLIDKSDIIKIALSKFSNYSKNDFLMIGDRQHDIIGANENKIDSIGALWGYGSKDELMAHNPISCLKEISELPVRLTN